MAPLCKGWREESLELVLSMFFLTIEYPLVLLGILSLSWIALVEATSFYLLSDVSAISFLADLL